MIQAGRSMTNSPKYSSEAIREAWKREAKQRWDGRTHGRGLSLLIVKMLALPGGLVPSSCELVHNHAHSFQNRAGLRSRANSFDAAFLRPAAQHWLLGGLNGGPQSKACPKSGCHVDFAPDFLLGHRKPVFVEPGDHNAVADADKTSADLVLVSPKFECWRPCAARHQATR